MAQRGNMIVPQFLSTDLCVPFQDIVDVTRVWTVGIVILTLTFIRFNAELCDSVLCCLLKENIMGNEAERC